MAFEKRDMSGSLFKNTDKQQPNHPDYKGSAQIDGVDLWMDAWIKKSENGKTWMSFSFKRKEQRQEPARDTRTHAERKRPMDDDLSDIPF